MKNKFTLGAALAAVLVFTYQLSRGDGPLESGAQSEDNANAPLEMPEDRQRETDLVPMGGHEERQLLTVTTEVPKETALDRKDQGTLLGSSVCGCDETSSYREIRDACNEFDPAIFELMGEMQSRLDPAQLVDNPYPVPKGQRFVLLDIKHEVNGEHRIKTGYALVNQEDYPAFFEIHRKIKLLKALPAYRRIREIRNAEREAILQQDIINARSWFEEQHALRDMQKQ
ncbi:MAG: hypothetical protein GY930_11260 [bacterium]|nr:hypothetical protein [bacterium]